MQVDSHSRSDPQMYLTQALTSPQLPDELKPFYQAFERFWSNRCVTTLLTTLNEGRVWAARPGDALRASWPGRGHHRREAEEGFQTDARSL